MITENMNVVQAAATEAGKGQKKKKVHSKWLLNT